MADTTFTQADLQKIEEAIQYVMSDPARACKGRIDYDAGGGLSYRSLQELFDARDNIKAILDNETDLDLDAVKKNAWRPFSIYSRNNGQRST